MSPCIKNPCKICRTAVSVKNGLQCQGACAGWVHFSCLNYTPGKIKDIKSGIIKVNCPCPDCKSNLPKEYRTDKVPFTCNSSQCPARRPPACENEACPVNKCLESDPNRRSDAPQCPLSACGTDCKKHSVKQLPEGGTQPRYGKPCAEASLEDAAKSGGQPVPPSPSHAPDGERDNDMKGNSSMPNMEELCQTIGELTNQINDMMCKMKQMTTMTATNANSSNLNRGFTRCHTGVERDCELLESSDYESSM